MAGAGKRRLPAGGSPPAGAALPAAELCPPGRGSGPAGRSRRPAGHAGKRPLLPGPGAERTAPAAQGPGNAGCPGVPRRPGRPCHCGAGPGIPPHLFPFHPRRDPGPGVGGAETAPPPLRLPPPVRGGPAARRAGLWPRVRGASGEGPGRRSQRRAGPAPPDGLQPGPDGGRPAKIHAGLLRRPLIRPVAAGEPGAGALRGRAPGLPPVLRHRRRHS